MWEDLTIALCSIGFVVVVAILLVELPAVLNPASKPTLRPMLRPTSRSRGHGHR